MATLSKNIKNKNVYGIIFSVIIVAVVIVLIFAFNSKGINVSVLDNLTISAPMVSKEIAYSDIATVQLTDAVPSSTRTNGYGGVKISSGQFKCDAFGFYTRATYNDTKKYIVIKLNDGHYIVVNLKTADDTIQIYNQLSEKLYAKNS